MIKPEATPVFGGTGIKCWDSNPCCSKVPTEGSYRRFLLKVQQLLLQQMALDQRRIRGPAHNDHMITQ